MRFLRRIENYNRLGFDFCEKAIKFSLDGTSFGMSKHKKYARVSAQYFAAEALTLKALLSFIAINKEAAEMILEEFPPDYVHMTTAPWVEILKKCEASLSDIFEDASVDERTKQKARKQAQKHIALTYCAVCGASPKGLLHRHHWSYLEPIDVFQLCIHHHFKLHKLSRAQGHLLDKAATEKWIKKNSLLYPALTESFNQ